MLNINYSRPGEVLSIPMQQYARITKYAGDRLSDEDKEIIKKAKKLSWILSYDISHKVKKIKKLYNIFGYTMCGKILEKYLKWK